LENNSPYEYQNVSTELDSEARCGACRHKGTVAEFRDATVAVQRVRGRDLGTALNRL
jgi:hypothetical protein